VSLVTEFSAELKSVSRFSFRILNMRKISEHVQVRALILCQLAGVGGGEGRRRPAGGYLCSMHVCVCVCVCVCARARKREREREKGRERGREREREREKAVSQHSCFEAVSKARH
jgi:hypothetical protein